NEIVVLFTTNWFENSCEHLFPKVVYSRPVETKSDDNSDNNNSNNNNNSNDNANNRFENVANKPTSKLSQEMADTLKPDKANSLKRDETDDLFRLAVVKSERHEKTRREKISESVLNIDVNRMELYIHDENYDRLPPILVLGFTDLHVRSTYTGPIQGKVEAHMLWHGSKFDEKNNNPSPLICPWQCSVAMKQDINPEMEIEIQSTHPIDAFISDIVVSRLQSNANHWIAAFSSPSESEMNTKKGHSKSGGSWTDIALMGKNALFDREGGSRWYSSQSTTDVLARRNRPINRSINEIPSRSHHHNKSDQSMASKVNRRALSTDVAYLKNKTEQLLVKWKVDFLVPHFSLFLEKPSMNVTICKIETHSFHVQYLSDEKKEYFEIKTKYIGLYDYVQQAGKSFQMLVETTHSMRNEFLKIVFVHLKFCHTFCVTHLHLFPLNAFSWRAIA
ncbi:hypothetical protein RFI_07819, partial [Reticulomyxa filosa]